MWGHAAHVSREREGVHMQMYSRPSRRDNSAPARPSSRAGGGPRFLLVASSSGRGGTGEMTERMEGGGVENRLHIDVYVHVL